MTGETIQIFDGHNDSLTEFYDHCGGDLTGFLKRNQDGHLDLPRARETGLVGGLFAIQAPDRLGGFADATEPEHDDGTAYRFGLPPELDHKLALAYTESVISGLEKLVVESKGGIFIARDAEKLEAGIDNGQFAIVLHIEGAEAIDTDLANLDRLYDRGLRSLGIVWSRPNRFGHGVPYAYPASPDIGPGLTGAGRALVRALNQKGILLDLSHLNEKGFWEVAALSSAPLVASHSNAHALCPSTRNLTDKQLEAVAESDGLVGVTFCVGFLRADGRPNTDTPLSIVVDHIDYITNKIGLDHVAFGSDFDGATIPEALHDVGGFPRILELLRERGYDNRDIRKITFGNWLRVLRATWR